MYERELMAIVLAVQKWRPYLLGRKFLVKTDQRSLKYLLEQRLMATEHQKWLTKILGYDFDIQYISGKDNKAADALSRLHEEPLLAAISAPNILSIPDLHAHIASDPTLSKVLKELEAGKDSGGYTLSQGCLKFKGLLVLPATSPFIPIILQEYHSSHLGGHSSIFRTFQRIAEHLYWPGMRKDIHKFVAECSVCQQNKYSAQSPAGLLQPLPIPEQIWEDISMDFIEGLPVSNDFDTIFVVVDRLSKYAHFIPLRHPFTAAIVATIFVREVVKLHGIPKTIVSDRDKIFLSLFWKEIFKFQGTSLNRSTAYHPQSDGQTEVVNRCLETYLRCFVSTKPSKWSKWIPWAEYWYNTTFHASTGMTPFKAVYHRDPPPILRFEQYSTPVSAVEQNLQDRDQILDLLKENLLRAQQKMKFQADKKRRDVHYNVGDYVTTRKYIFHNTKYPHFQKRVMVNLT